MTILHLLVTFLTFGQTPSLVLADHDFKLSVCEIVYSPDKQAFDLKFYIFQDDLKAALYNNPNAPEIRKADAGDYILKHFSLSLDGRPLALKLRSMEEKNDQVLLHFTTPKAPPSPTAALSVKNTLLIGNFRDQINMLYLIFPEKEKKTLMMNATKTVGNFSF